MTFDYPIALNVKSCVRNILCISFSDVEFSLPQSSTVSLQISNSCQITQNLTKQDRFVVLILKNISTVIYSIKRRVSLAIPHPRCQEHCGNTQELLKIIWKDL